MKVLAATANYIRVAGGCAVSRDTAADRLHRLCYGWRRVKLVIFPGDALPADDLSAARKLRNAQQRIAIVRVGAGEIFLEVCEAIVVRITLRAIVAGRVIWSEMVLDFPGIRKAISVGISDAEQCDGHQPRDFQRESIAVVTDLNVMLASTHSSPGVAEVAF